MARKKLEPVRQFEIAKPCPEDWEAMQGDNKQRYCAGCGCFVHNVSEMAVDQAEELLVRPERVCVRVIADQKRGVLTRDGWIPRLMLAGALAATVAGCSEPTNAEPLTGSLAPSTEVRSPQKGSLVEVEKQKEKTEVRQLVGQLSPPPQTKK